MGDIDHAAGHLFELACRIAERAAARIDRHLHLAVGALGEILGPGLQPVALDALPRRQEMAELEFDLLSACRTGSELGSASCRERVCQYVQLSVAAFSFKNNTLIIHK